MIPITVRRTLKIDFGILSLQIFWCSAPCTVHGFNENKDTAIVIKRLILTIYTKVQRTVNVAFKPK